MRNALASIFRLLFRLPFFRKRYYGFHKRLFFPYKLFKGVKKRVAYFGVQLDLRIDDWIQENIYFLNEYERAELTFLKKYLGAGDVFIDIGANIGLFSLVASERVGNDGAVYSFEASKKNYNRLLEHIELNDAKNIKAHQLAIANKEKEIAFYYNEEEANRGMISAYANQTYTKETVAATSLDSFVNFEKIDFIKLDIEGGEYDALLGMEQTLLRCKPTLIIELEDEIIAKTNYTKKDVVDFLQNIGYQLYFMNDYGNWTEVEENASRKNYIFLHDKKIK